MSTSIPAQSTTSSKRVVCLGASIVRGQFSASFVDLLVQRMGNDGYEFINAGVNGDLAYNVAVRLESVLAYQPDFIVILVGTNDVTGMLSPRLAQSVVKFKKLPQLPTFAWYSENILAIVRRLKSGCAARIALCSLPNLGEDLDSPVNATLRTYNAALADIATQEQIAYVPVNECQSDYLRSHQTTAGRRFDVNTVQSLTLKMLLFRLVFRFSLDRIARMNGFLLTTEGIHMNSLGATIIADQIETFLRSG